MQCPYWVLACIWSAHVLANCVLRKCVCAHHTSAALVKPAHQDKPVNCCSRQSVSTLDCLDVQGPRASPSLDKNFSSLSRLYMGQCT
eukprot:886147-Amphidinium_carterae.1